MIMINGYYVIRPTAALKERLNMIKIDADLAEILFETKSWQHHRVGLVKDGTGDDIAEVKLLFLANLMPDYLSKCLYQTLLEENCISLELFDKWWAIERYLVDEISAEVEERIDTAVARFFVKTGLERVDFWIDKMQKKKT